MVEELMRRGGQLADALGVRRPVFVVCPALVDAVEGDDPVWQHIFEERALLRRTGARAPPTGPGVARFSGARAQRLEGSRLPPSGRSHAGARHQ